MLGPVVDEAAERFGDRTAYVSAGGEPISYIEFRHRTLRAAWWLREQGVRAGDVVALVLPATVEYLALYVGAARLGAVTAGVNWRLTPHEQAVLLELVEPALTVRPGDVPDLSAGSPRPSLAVRAGGSPVAIVFTSGTTGRPKAAVFDTRQLEAITAIDTGGRWGGGGGQLAGTSFASLGPMTKLPGNLMRGGTTYLIDRWQARLALELTERHRLTTVAGIPTQVALMLADPDFEGFDLSSVRAIVMGGGPATPALVREARTRFRAPVAIRYSCTEAGIGLGTAFDAPAEDAELSVGRPHPGVELAILDRDLRPVGPGEIGEVCLRSPASMSGYWHDPEATAAAFTPDGFVRTGDLGRVDEQGRLRLAGRRKEMYVRGGYNVYPVEVEAVLAEHPAVAEVAIVARPDPVMGEIGVAAVVARAGSPLPTLDELRTFARDRLAHHKLPERLVLLDALPLTPAEKVDRRALADLVAGLEGRADDGR
ncbi:class I adenylate-forming enzyme family protein [Rhabdothermincola sp.]|uniref:class I adenylate-forming enzyme family protein n=1 Tax=Rhabdothermincola sp. TaxID=2820405 RepID=UPI002FDFB837